MLSDRVFSGEIAAQASPKARGSQPLMVVEGSLGEPAECVCGPVLSVWEVSHQGRSHGTCSVQACSDCWAKWLNSRDAPEDLRHAPCICNRGTVALECLQTVLKEPDYRSLCDKAALAAKTLEGWFPCPNASCSYGHMHEPSDGPKWTCQNEDCNTAACTTYCSPWHGGETCESISARTQTDVLPLYIVEQDFPRATVRHCPRCSHAYYRASGCKHITCRCGFEFCYDCECECVREKTISAILMCIHDEGCAYHIPERQGFQYTGVSWEELERDQMLLWFPSCRCMDVGYDFGTRTVLKRIGDQVTDMVDEGMCCVCPD